MSPALKTNSTLTARPTFVTLGVILIVVDALLGAVSPHVLFHLSPSSKGLVLPFQPGVWIVALLQILLSLLLWRGKGWLRYLLLAWAVSLIADYIFVSDLKARFQSFPLATARDILSLALLAAAALLLLLPASTAWFNTGHATSDA